jgi:hypothetical protein
MKTNNYKCPKCNKVITRESEKQWIRSYCGSTGEDVRLQIIKDDTFKPCFTCQNPEECKSEGVCYDTT